MHCMPGLTVGHAAEVVHGQTSGETQRARDEMRFESSLVLHLAVLGGQRLDDLADSCFVRVSQAAQRSGAHEGVIAPVAGFEGSLRGVDRRLGGFSIAVGVVADDFARSRVDALALGARGTPLAVDPMLCLDGVRHDIRFCWLSVCRTHHGKGLPWSSKRPIALR
jgi:hypothetical protein